MVVTTSAVNPGKDTIATEVIVTDPSEPGIAYDGTKSIQFIDANLPDPKLGVCTPGHLAGTASGEIGLIGDVTGSGVCSELVIRPDRGGETQAPEVTERSGLGDPEGLQGHMNADIRPKELYREKGVPPIPNDASARVASGLPTSAGKHLAAGLCRSSWALAVDSGGDNFCTLKVDTQAEDTIVNDPAFFLDGIDTSHRLELLTITPGGEPQYTAGRGTATFVCADGTHLNISNAHLYVGGTTNVLGTKELKLTYSKTDKKETSLHWAPRAVVKGASDSTFALAHSTSGYVHMLANAAISWVAKKQETIATSPYQAEIVAGSLRELNRAYPAED